MKRRSDNQPLYNQKSMASTLLLAGRQFCPCIPIKSESMCTQTKARKEARIHVDPNQGKKGSKLNSCKIRIHVHPNEGKKGSKLNTWLKSLIHLRFSTSEQTHTWFEGHHSVNKGEYNYPNTLKVKKNGQVVVRAQQLKIRKNLGNKSSLRNEQNDIIWSLIGRHNSMHWEIASSVAIYVACIYSGCREEWGIVPAHEISSY